MKFGTGGGFEGGVVVVLRESRPGITKPGDGCGGGCGTDGPLELRGNPKRCGGGGGGGGGGCGKA